MVKKDNYSVQELTQREISRLNADERVNKLKKECSRYKRAILKCKENEKILRKKLAQLTQNIGLIKENTIGSLYSLSENIIGIKESFLEYCDRFADEIERENLKSFSKEFDYISDFVINVCNAIEMNSNTGEFEDYSYDEQYENDYSGATQNTLNDEYQWDFKSSNKKNVENNHFASDKIRKLFYDKPSENNKVNSYLEDDGDFNFNEALNPTMSLNDIMADLIPSDNENTDNKFNTPTTPIEESSKNDEKQDNSDYDAWFMSLQNIISKETKK